MYNAKTILEKLHAGAFREKFAHLYCCSPDETDIYAGLYADLVAAFTASFGAPERVGLFSAPGRTEIGGNHTDHQNGCVLAGSVTLDIAAVAAPNGLQAVRMISDSRPVEVVDLTSLAPDPGERFTSSALVRGMASRFLQAGHHPRGFDMVASSTILNGSGLSSSAAFEVLIGVVFNELFCGGRIEPIELAKFGKYAENEFFGKPCGLMDQLASAVGGFLFVDFAQNDAPCVEKIEIDLTAHNHVLCIIDSGANHAGLSDIYAAIPREMRQVAAFFGKERLREVEFIDVVNNLKEVRKIAGDRAALRALHFFTDNQRAMDEASALKSGRFDDFLRLVTESGRSSAMYLQNTHIPGSDREQAMDVALALCAQILRGRGASRVHGGGFAGTVQAFVPMDMLDSFALEMDAALGRGNCHILSIRPEGGVRLI